MDVGKFKTIDFDDDDALPAWLRSDDAPITPLKHVLPNKPLPPVKSTEGFTASQVKPQLVRPTPQAHRRDA
jgi:hypothetical protein